MLSLGPTGCHTQSLSNFILLEMFLNMFMGCTCLAKLQLTEKSNVSTQKPLKGYIICKTKID